MISRRYLLKLQVAVASMAMRAMNNEDEDPATLEPAASILEGHLAAEVNLEDQETEVMVEAEATEAVSALRAATLREAVPLLHEDPVGEVVDISIETHFRISRRIAWIWRT
jgi:hypothetical protein